MSAAGKKNFFFFFDSNDEFFLLLLLPFFPFLFSDVTIYIVGDYEV